MLQKTTERIIGPVALLGVLLLLVESSPPLREYPHIVFGLNMGILALFAADVLLSLATARHKRAWLTRHWFDCIVFLPIIQQLFFTTEGSLATILRLAALVAMLLSRSRRAHTFLRLFSFHPTQHMLISFAGAIAFGAILLMLPAANAAGRTTSPLDALFTATSAVCVTGLIVHDTAVHFSRFGQAIILLLIQIGGIGIMTFSGSLVLMMRRSVSMKNQSIMQDVLDQETLQSARRLILFIVTMTLLFEVIGAILLFRAWHPHFERNTEALWHAVFHAVSAFCNAGFSTFSNSLTAFAADVPTNAVVCTLIVVGGLGFVVMNDLYQALKQRLLRSRTNRRFRVQTRLALSWTAALLLLGALLFFWIERERILTGKPLSQSLLISVFQSVTTRTAGFNTCNTGALHPATLIFFIVFMFLGACPGGTAGGIKLTTPAILWAVARSGLTGQEKPQIHRCSVPADAIRKATMLLSGSLLIVFGALFLLALTETHQPFLGLFFETISAFGTVGLSTGVTPSLSAPGRVLITLLMFIGRLGPLTIGFAFLRRRRPAKYAYAEERIMIG